MPLACTQVSCARIWWQTGWGGSTGVSPPNPYLNRRRGLPEEQQHALERTAIRIFCFFEAKDDKFAPLTPFEFQIKSTVDDLLVRMFICCPIDASAEPLPVPGMWNFSPFATQAAMHRVKMHHYHLRAASNPPFCPLNVPVPLGSLHSAEAISWCYLSNAFSRLVHESLTALRCLPLLQRWRLL